MSKRKTAGDDPYVVVLTEFPAVGSGVHRGRQFSKAELVQRTTYEIRGEFATKEDANAGALKVRMGSAYFEDWADKHFKKAAPPWDSTEGDNCDNDEEQCIRVMLRSTYEAELASNAALLAKSAAAAAKAAGKAKNKKQAELAKSGRVHYSFPGPPRGVDRPASLEAVVGKDGAAYAVPRGEALSVSGGKHRQLTLEELAACKSLLVHGRGGDCAADVKDEELMCFKRGMTALLGACASLDELHWHDAMAISELLTGRVDGSPEDAAELPETRLTKSLKVLSIPHTRYFAPEDLEDLARFSALERVDLRGSLELEYGISNPKCYKDPYLSDSDGEDEEPMPYTEGMLAMADANKKLKEIDLDGILDFDGFKYTLDNNVVEELASKGVRVKLGRKTAW
mmetsp:Transcript_11354/g.33379  ORF Transcript_11354/g.33379 Transcript_11354/m.33379 type:complete len:397 (+) Transcript_11354:68-1258(+)